MSFGNPANTFPSFLFLYSAFALISISFYAQLIHNWKRKKISGLNINYLIFGLVSYIHYALFITGYYFIYFYIPFIRLDSTAIEILFALHSFIGFLLLSTPVAFEWDKTFKQISILTKIIIPLSLIITFLLYVFPLMIQGSHFNLAAYALVFNFYLLYCLKYLFQIEHNHSRKSTIGFNILYCLIDLGGNAFGLMYYSHNISLAIDSNWIDIIGLFCFCGGILGDIGLIIQHWVLFANSNSDLGQNFFENYLINRLE